MKWTSLAIVLLQLSFQQLQAQDNATQAKSPSKQWGISLDLPLEFQLNGYPGDISLGTGLGCWYQWRSWRFYTGVRVLTHNYTQLPANWSTYGFEGINFDAQIPLAISFFALNNRLLALGPFVQADWRPRYTFHAYSDDYFGYWTLTDPFQVLHIEHQAVRPPGWGFAEGVHLVLKPKAPITFDLQIGMQHSLLKQEVTSKISAYTGHGFENIYMVVNKKLPVHSLLINLQLNLKI